MKLIQPTQKTGSWPRRACPSIECRKRDLVIRIADWTRNGSEPAYDVEIYIGGVYDYNESKTFCTVSAGQTKEQAKARAIAYASTQTAKLL